MFYVFVNIILYKRVFITKKTPCFSRSRSHGVLRHNAFRISKIILFFIISNIFYNFVIVTLHYGSCYGNVTVFCYLYPLLCVTLNKINNAIKNIMCSMLERI